MTATPLRLTEPEDGPRQVYKLADAAVILGHHYSWVNDWSKKCPGSRVKNRGVSAEGWCVDLDVFLPWLAENKPEDYRAFDLAAGLERLAALVPTAPEERRDPQGPNPPLAGGCVPIEQATKPTKADGGGAKQPEMPTAKPAKSTNPTEATTATTANGQVLNEFVRGASMVLAQIDSRAEQFSTDLAVVRAAWHREYQELREQAAERIGAEARRRLSAQRGLIAAAVAVAVVGALAVTGWINHHRAAAVATERAEALTEAAALTERLNDRRTELAGRLAAAETTIADLESYRESLTSAKAALAEQIDRLAAERDDAAAQTVQKSGLLSAQDAILAEKEKTIARLEKLLEAAAMSSYNKTDQTMAPARQQPPGTGPTPETEVSTPYPISAP